MENYIDPDIIDKIRAASKPPTVKRKTILNGDNKKNDQKSAIEENKLRIEKMKKLYGLYKQFQEEEEKNPSGTSIDKL